LCFVAIAVLLLKVGLGCSSNIYFNLITFVMALLQPLSYLAVALSDPGVVTHSTVEPLPSLRDGEERSEPIAGENYGRQNIRFCKMCNIYVERSTRHCSDCQLCIQEYDHHCPWVSKCIGRGNLKRFYFFVTMTPIFIVYAIITICVCMTLEAETGFNNMRTHGKSL